MSTRIWFTGIIITLLLVSCNRRSIKKQETPVITGIWTERFSFKQGSGELHLITPGKSVNAMFDFTYDKMRKELKGSLYGFLSVKVAEFSISPSRVEAKTLTGGNVNIDSLLNVAGIPPGIFIKCFGYDFDTSVLNEKGIPVNNGILVSRGDMDILLSRENRLPVKVVMLNGGEDIEVLYSDFRNVEGYKHPFYIVFSTADKKLEIHFKKIVLQ